MQTTPSRVGDNATACREAGVGSLEIRAATSADFPLLARLNRELIEDEGDRNPMTVAELEARFHRFVGEEGYQVDVLTCGGDVVGYATYCHRPDNTEPSGRHLYLRQFYIARERRGGGIGRDAVNLLFSRRFLSGERVFLNVLETNPGGKAFWSKTGFTPYATSMERVVPTDAP